MPSSSNAALNVFVWLCIALFSSLQHFQLTIAQESGGRVGLGGECVKQNGLAILGLSNKELLIVNISSNKRIRFCFLLLGFFFFYQQIRFKNRELISVILSPFFTSYTSLGLLYLFCSSIYYVTHPKTGHHLYLLDSQCCGLSSPSFLVSSLPHQSR